MANPLFNALGGASPVPAGMNDGGFSQMLHQLNSFRQSFRGNPREEVQRLLSSGQMSQAQYNQLAQMANQITALMRK